jgi:glycosyltransferase involved in cell wall biosynthesis
MERLQLMHVLIYSDDPGIGGVAQFDHAFSLGLIKAGFRVGLVQTRQMSPQAKERIDAGIEHYWLDYNTTTDFTRTFKNQDEPENLFEVVRPDLILFSDSCPVSNFAAKKAALAQGIPYIARVGFVAPYLAENFASALVQLGELYRHAKAVVAVSRENLGLLERLFRLPPERGRVIYSGKSKLFFEPGEQEDRRERRISLGIPKDGVLCFTAARLEIVKGYQYQLSAIEVLRTRPIWDRLFFAWAGPGSLHDELETIIVTRGLTRKIHLLGQCWDVPAWLDAADIFVLPAQAEGLPQAVMEAMAKRLPVISTRVSGIPEALADTGVLLPDPLVDPQGVVQGLIQNIEELTTNGDRRRVMGEACFHRADRQFHAERMVDDYIALLTDQSEYTLKNSDSSRTAVRYISDLQAMFSRHALPKSHQEKPFRSSLCSAPDEVTAQLLANLYAVYRDELVGLTERFTRRRAEIAELGLLPTLSEAEGALLYILVRELKPDLVYEIGCGWGEASAYILAALTRNGLGRIELFEAATTVIGLPVETALRCALPPDCDATRHHLNSGDPRRAIAARSSDECPDLLLIGPTGDEILAEWMVKLMLPRVQGPMLIRGVLHGAPCPAESAAALYFLSYFQHAGVEPLPIAFYEKQLGAQATSSLAVLVSGPGQITVPLDAYRCLLDGRAGNLCFPLASESLQPGSIRAHRWDGTMPPEDRFVAVWHAGVIDRTRLGCAELEVLHTRAWGGSTALPSGVLDHLVDNAALLDPYTLVLLVEAAGRSANPALCGRLLNALKTVSDGGWGTLEANLSTRIARVVQSLSQSVKAQAWGELAEIAPRKEG